MQAYWHYARKLFLVLSVLGMGLASGWWFEGGNLLSVIRGVFHSPSVKTYHAMERGILNVSLRYGCKSQWITTKEQSKEEKEYSIRKRVWRIQVPGNLPFAVVSMACKKSVVDSGGMIIEEKDCLGNRMISLTLGIDSVICDSVIISRKVNGSQGKGEIALIIDDFGYEITPAVNGFLAFPVKIGISVIPKQPVSRFVAEEAYNRDFEVLIHLPVEPKEPLIRHEFVMLKSGMNGKEVSLLMDDVEKSVPGAIGLNNHTGSKGTEDTALMAFLARELLLRKLYFIDSFTTMYSQAFNVMQAMKVPAMRRDIFIDHEESPSFIREQLQRLMEIANKKGVAVGIAHATKPLSFAILCEEVPKLADMGYDFVFPSELVYRKEIAKK